MKHILAFLPLLLLASCQGTQPEKPSISKDFSAFYERFHRDSLYQMQHITFPLEGIPDNVAQLQNAEGRFRWTREEWDMHKPIDFSQGEFRQELNLFGDRVVNERIISQDNNYALLRRFARIGEEWYLIYYAGLNPIKQVQ